MDPVAELERMAVNAVDDDSAEFEPSEDEIQRWQSLFAYSSSEAVEQIKNQKGDYSRRRVSDDHWELVKTEKEAQGFSRDAYDHWMKMGGQSAYSHEQRKHVDTPASQSNPSYLVLLEGILNTPKSIQEAANLPEPIHTVQAASETRDAVFCEIDGKIKQSIENWLSQQNFTFRPTFIRISKAKKDLDSNSIYPTLGLESTLPQHRFSSDRDSNATLAQSPAPSNRTGRHLVLQDEYPAWYFFYGTLADPEVLTRLLSPSEAEPPTLVPASISRGLIKSWGGKHKALVDGDSTDYVHGSAYEVASREQEDALLTYETENYEVVRCSITMASETVHGLTFRFVGSL